MKCSLENKEELIRRYLLNELSDEESLRFEEHYFSCEECFKQLRAAEETFALIKLDGKSLKESVERKSLFDKIFGSSSNSFKWAIGFASIIILLLIGYTLLNTGSENVKEEIAIVDQKDSLKNLVSDELKKDESEIEVKEKQKDLIAELSGPSFKANPYYEEWMNENVRSGNILIDKVILPKNGDKYLNQPVLFKWLMNENVPVNLVIMNNEDDIIFTSKVSADNFPEYSFSVNEKDLKKSGLYYWRIEDEIEVLYLGKFYFIRKQ